MLTKQPGQIITYKKITIYQKIYKLPLIKNQSLTVVQKKIKERRRLIKEGFRHHQLWGIIKRRQEISREKILQESQLLIKDYIHLIDFIEIYNEKYQFFLIKLMEDFKNLFIQKYTEIKSLDTDRKKLEIKHYKNQKIIEELKWENQENIKSILLLSNASFLMIEKIKLLSKGLKTLAEDTKNQKQIVQQVAKDLEVDQEIYEYQKKSYKIRQEIVKIAETALNFENYIQDDFIPFQSLIDEVVKVDEDFYSTVGDIKSLADNIFKSQSNLLIPKEISGISETFIDFMVSSYEKKERLKDAFLQCQSLDWQAHNFDLADNSFCLEKDIESISNYIFNQLAEQRKEIGITEIKYISAIPLLGVNETESKNLNNDNALTKEFKNKNKIDYTQLQYLLSQAQWKEADVETTKLMLKVIGKSYWNEVYKEDINNFSCKDIQIINQLWEEYSHGYFGFKVQQSIWSEIGGKVDYETEKRLGDRLGWRKEGNWLDYEQLTFKLSPITPMGHLPAKWLHYDQHPFDLFPNASVEHLSMGAWRVESWLIWQMHLFFSRVKICNVT